MRLLTTAAGRRSKFAKHVAMAQALRRAGPAIAASAGTVVAALLVLGLADVASTAALGLLGAAGIALAALVTLTILPALLLLAGRRAFWPFVPAFGSEGADERHGAWRRVGDAIGRGPRRVWIGAATVLLDTFLVRSLLVPALVLDLGDRTWWPRLPLTRLGFLTREGDA